MSAIQQDVKQAIEQSKMGEYEVERLIRLKSELERGINFLREYEILGNYESLKKCLQSLKGIIMEFEGRGGRSRYGIELYELCLIPELPRNGKPAAGKLYLEKKGDKLKYTVLSLENEKIEGELDILVEGTLTKEILSSKKLEILRATLNRGHTYSEKYYYDQASYYYGNVIMSSSIVPLLGNVTKVRIHDFREGESNLRMISTPMAKCRLAELYLEVSDPSVEINFFEDEDTGFTASTKARYRNSAESLLRKAAGTSNIFGRTIEGKDEQEKFWQARAKFKLANIKEKDSGSGFAYLEREILNLYKEAAKEGYLEGFKSIGDFHYKRYNKLNANDRYSDIRDEYNLNQTLLHYKEALGNYEKFIKACKDNLEILFSKAASKVKIKPIPMDDFLELQYIKEDIKKHEKLIEQAEYSLENLKKEEKERQKGLETYSLPSLPLTPSYDQLRSREEYTCQKRKLKSEPDKNNFKKIKG